MISFFCSDSLKIRNAYCESMGYRYVFIIAGAAIAAAVLFLVLYHPQGQQITASQIPTGKDNLTLCSHVGTNPFMEGFFLRGAEVYTLKTWDWGDGIKENNTSVVVNHEYRLENGTSRQFSGSVTEWKDAKMKIGRDRENFTVTVNAVDFKNIERFDQYEGVIVEGDYAGFSVSTNLTAPFFKWTWLKGDTGEPKIEGYSNPSHQYSGKQTYNGFVTVDSKGIPAENRDFCVMTVSNDMNLTGYISVGYDSNVPSPLQMVFWANRSLNFIEQSGPAALSVLGAAQSQVWSFGDGSSASFDSNPSHKYAKAGVYRIEYNGSYPTGPLDLVRTVTILDPPVIHAYPPSGPVNTMVTVNGSNFMPNIQYDVYFGNNNQDDNNVTADRWGNFTTTFDVTSQFLSGPQRVHVEYNGTTVTEANFQRT
ncbi:MAG: hypothetical protein KGI25_00110 [Thaumarchaeota archaeon]|nr:hypothetical protein [Nitrososphaerota archaeon]